MLPAACSRLQTTMWVLNKVICHLSALFSCFIQVNRYYRQPMGQSVTRYIVSEKFYEMEMFWQLSPFNFFFNFSCIYHILSLSFPIYAATKHMVDPMTSNKNFQRTTGWSQPRCWKATSYLILSEKAEISVVVQSKGRCVNMDIRVQLCDSRTHCLHPVGDSERGWIKMCKRQAYWDRIKESTMYVNCRSECMIFQTVRHFTSFSGSTHPLCG